MKKFMTIAQKVKENFKNAYGVQWVDPATTTK